VGPRPDMRLVSIMELAYPYAAGRDDTGGEGKLAWMKMTSCWGGVGGGKVYCR
jgi:hypothetical protein